MKNFECKILKGVWSPCEWAKACMENRIDDWVKDAKIIQKKYNRWSYGRIINEADRLNKSGLNVEEIISSLRLEFDLVDPRHIWNIVLCWVMSDCARKKIIDAFGYDVLSE